MDVYISKGKPSCVSSEPTAGHKRVDNVVGWTTHLKNMLVKLDDFHM